MEVLVERFAVFFPRQRLSIPSCKEASAESIAVLFIYVVGGFWSLMPMFWNEREIIPYTRGSAESISGVFFCKRER